MNSLSALKQSKVIAIVSGKGGSGKTMLAATMAKLIDDQGEDNVLLIDADFGTAGLTYYMGLNEVKNITVGLTNLLHESDRNHINAVEQLAQKMESFSRTSFIGIGDHRRYLKQYKNESSKILETFLSFIFQAKEKYQVIIVDCRGGIDEESIAVCSAVDDILIVAETDTTSFQSTQYLVDTLYDNGLSIKLRGFFINKVFDDPSTIARSGTSAFRTQYLSAIPFDLDATRSFLVGDIPSISTYFGRQIWHGVYKGFPDLLKRPSVPPLRPSDFRGLSIRDKDSLLGGMLLSFMSIGLGSGLILQISTSSSLHVNDKFIFLLAMLIIISSMSGIEPARKIIGRVLSLYIKLISRLVFGLTTV